MQTVIAILFCESAFCRTVVVTFVVVLIPRMNYQLWVLDLHHIRTPIASLLGLVFIIAFPADSVRRVSPNFLVAVVTFADWYSGLFRLRQNRPQTQDTIRPHLRLEATNHIFHLFSAVIMLFKIIATAVIAAVTAISAIIFFIFIHFVSAIR